MRDQLLSICIPTYNRAEQLRSNLSGLVPQAQVLGIAICVSDNASTDETAQVVKEFIAVYPNIKYSRQQETIAGVCNYVAALRMAETPYAWLLGDDDRIVEGSLGKILKTLEKKDCELLVVNGGRKNNDGEEGRVKSPVQSRYYQDQDQLLSELGWHITWMSCLIFSRRIIAEANFSKYYSDNFMHFMAIFDYLSKERPAVYWENRTFIYAAGNELPSWFFIVFEVFGKRWYNAVMALPDSYTRQAKLTCIKAHGIESRCFSLKWLLGYRMFGCYNYHVYKQYRFYFPYLVGFPVWIMIAIALIPVPRFFIKWLNHYAMTIKGLLRGRLWQAEK